MGRRSTLTADQLKEFIVATTLSVVESQGLAGLSARKVARMIGYSPGTIYNVFANIDALLYEVQLKVLADIRMRLEQASESAPEPERFKRVVAAYAGYAEQFPRLWGLLFEHQPPASDPIPAEFAAEIAAIVGLFSSALDSDGDATGGPAAGAMAFGALNGLISVSVYRKFAGISAGRLDALAEVLAERVLGRRVAAT